MFMIPLSEERVSAIVQKHLCQVAIPLRKLRAMQNKIAPCNSLRLCVCVAGIMLLLLCFFAFLHCWLNLFGELLRFADRMFYKVCG